METSIQKTVSSPDKASSRSRRFVDHVLERMQRDTGFAARLKRADNPATEYQSWELLADFGIDLEKDWERLPYCLVGAALAKAKPERDGSLGLGAAIAASFEDGSQSGQARMRLRRVLACTSIQEVCLILRPLLALIQSRGVSLNFSQLLQQLTGYAGTGQDKIRSRWAQDFYRRPVDAMAGATAHD